jgi:hypothetical protein
MARGLNAAKVIAADTYGIILLQEMKGQVVFFTEPMTRVCSGIFQFFFRKAVLSGGIKTLLRAHLQIMTNKGGIRPVKKHRRAFRNQARGKTNMVPVHMGKEKICLLQVNAEFIKAAGKYLAAYLKIRPGVNHERAVTIPYHIDINVPQRVTGIRKLYPVETGQDLFNH